MVSTSRVRTAPSTASAIEASSRLRRASRLSRSRAIVRRGSKPRASTSAELNAASSGAPAAAGSNRAASVSRRITPPVEVSNRCNKSRTAGVVRVFRVRAGSEYRQQRFQLFDRERSGLAAHVLDDQRIDDFASEILFVRVETGDRVARNLPGGASCFRHENFEELCDLRVHREVGRIDQPRRQIRRRHYRG